jgi:manganese/zinc/iron transport system permease protein
MHTSQREGGLVLMIALLTTHYTLIIVCIGTMLLGITAGALGVFALLRKQSLLGDTISHAALPGIALMFLATHSRNPLILILGGSIAGCIGTILMLIITRLTKLKQDTVLGIILSVFFGVGLVLMTVIQKYSIPHQSILNKFLFGSASTLVIEDIYAMALIAIITLSCLALFWKEFALLTFDYSYAHTCGYPVTLLDILLTILMVLAISLGLQTVGVVLMSAMLIAPAAAAYQWTTRLSSMVFLASCIGALSSFIGSLISSWYTHIPTGPTIVVILSICVLISFFCTPHHVRVSS